MIGKTALVITSFCMDADNNLVVCSGGKSQKQGIAAAIAQSVFGGDQRGRVSRFSSDRKQLGSCDLEFVPTAIDIASDGTIFVAGNGVVAKISHDLKLIKSAESPHIEDLEARNAQVLEDFRAEEKENERRLEELKKKYRTAIADLNTIPEAERTAAQKAQLTSKKELLQRLEAPPAVLSIFGDLTADRFAKEMTKIAMPSIAISDDYLFLTCSDSMHYDVWRFDHNFENPKKVVRRAVGCCRQLDIQSDGKDLLVAENAKFRVVRFDNRGKKLSQFGSRGGKAAGFGSCCNPMNIRCCGNGDILTAESSVGDIKRFSPDGKLQALIGTAEVGAGCKRVTLEHDTELDRYYIMHEDHGYICVLVPMSEAPEFTEQELATKEAREGLGKKLVGKWTLVAGSSKPSMAMSLIGFDTPPPKSLHFHDDGRLAFEGYLFSGPKNNNPEKSKHQQPKSRNRWVAKSQNGKKLVVFQMVDRVEALKFDMTFLADDKLRVVGLEGPLTVFTATFTTSEQSQK